jgi:RNA polymerase sigma-70 factor (ECF subfamily)
MANPEYEPVPDPVRDLAAYRPVMVRYFRKRVHPSEVDDLVQEVFLNIQARQTQTPIGNIEGYLFTVAVSVLMRKRQREQVGRLQDLYDDGSTWLGDQEEISPERLLLGREQLSVAVRAIEEMNPRTREVFLLHRFEDMTYSAIAKRYSISVSAVEKHIMTALKLLVAKTGRER